MESDIKKWLNHLSSMSNDHIVGYKRDIDFQSDYINDLINVCELLFSFNYFYLFFSMLYFTLFSSLVYLNYHLI